MPTHNPTPPGSKERDPNNPVDASTPQHGYEASDVSATGIAVFLASLLAFVAVFFVFCWGMGSVINNQLIKRDGPLNKWNALASGPSVPKNMASNPAMEQQQLQQLTQKFPTPRLEIDDGNQDLADLHVRESLLLDHYSWIDRGQGKIRIPIERAMELLVAQHALSVIPGAQPGHLPTYGETPEGAPMDTATSDIVLPPAPLTDGFAPTGYEQDLSTMRKAPEVAEADKHQ
jgi:hypothetical protein